MDILTTFIIYSIMVIFIYLAMGLSFALWNMAFIVSNKNKRNQKQKLFSGFLTITLFWGIKPKTVSKIIWENAKLVD